LKVSPVTSNNDAPFKSMNFAINDDSSVLRSEFYGNSNVNLN